MLRHHAVWRLAIYSFLSTDHGKLSSERPPNISVESLKLNGLDKEVVFSRRWVDILRIMLDSYSNIYFGWSLFRGGLYGCENQSEVSNLLPFHSSPPFHSTESRRPLLPCRLPARYVVVLLASLLYSQSRQIFWCCCHH